MRRVLIASGIVVACSGLLAGQTLFSKPMKVLGDPNFIGTAANPLAFDTVGPNWVEGRELNGPTAVAVDNSVSPPYIYIADTGNNRVLGFRYATQLVAGAAADIVIGQVDPYTNQAQGPANGGRSTGLSHPSGLAVDSSGNLYVSDSGNNRILRYPQPFAAANSNQFPSLVIGQKTLSTSTANLAGLSASSLSINGVARTGIAIDSAGNLWVSDTGNNRILRFPASALSAGGFFPAADTVLGQAAFNTNSSAGTSASSRTNLNGLTAPNGLTLDGAGNLFVTDQLFRVLEFPAPLSSGEAASKVFGVDTTSASATTPTPTALNGPLGVAAVSAGTFISDTNNNRVMLYSGAAAPSGQVSPSAVGVVGQTSFTLNQANMGNADASANSLSGPTDLAASATELFVVDTGNNRVLVFPYSIAGVGGIASRVIGQADFPYTGVNMVDSKGFSFASGFPSGAVLDNSVSPPRLYVADTLNNRVLGFKDFTHLKNGQSADLVLGQPDFNRTIVNYPSGSATKPGATGLNVPVGLAIDSSGNVYVADTGNSRVLRFPAPFASGQTAGEAADLVLGQQNFTSIITDATAVTLNGPTSIALTSAAALGSGGGYLVVSDAAQNRVLLYQQPFVSGMSAAVVLGQSNFTLSSATAGTAGLNGPRGVAVDIQDRVFVADTGNARVQIYGKASTLTNDAPPVISLAGVFSRPVAISTATAGDFWVTDNGANQLVHFPSATNLPLNNNASDATVPALAPHSGFVDPNNNLLVTDGINRVLYFVPQINVTNAANYSTRALAAGTIAALFPTVTTTIIAKGTATAPDGAFPLPATLADTQVTVGGTPAPLLFVSPGQDNVILPQSLATGGTADLLALRPSTGQILGGAEVQLAAASPGLFTQAAQGSGPALAVNVQDGTVNSSSHPVVRGQYVILYGTGVGPVTGAPADGQPASGQAAGDFPQVLIASSGTVVTSTGTTTLPPFIPATVNYSGLAPGFAGLWQINVQIPVNAQSGSAVVIKVYEKDIPNLDQSSSLTTTIAVR